MARDIQSDLGWSNMVVSSQSKGKECFVLKAALCFNIDPVAWKTLKNSYEGFGYQVVQRPSGRLPQKGGKYLNAPPKLNHAACGPTIPKDCKSITMYSGICMQIDGSNRITGPVPSTAQECRSADIAFLLDGSGSVSSQDFELMKRFVKNVVDSLLRLEARFSISQFSREPEVHYYFNNFFSGSQSWQSKVDKIRQRGGSTYTAKAIKFVVDNVFTRTAGSRPNVKKVLIVITDGESNDRLNLRSSADLAERNNIVRFAIGVGSAFHTSEAKQELETISSSPTENVFRVQNFNALEKIGRLCSKLFAIEGSQTGGESLKMEMGQEDSVQFMCRDRYGWGECVEGGYLQYSMDTHQKTGSFEANIEEDSYVGYSMAVARTKGGTLTIMGAPRYKHPRSCEGSLQTPELQNY
ncbi:hypothetical protein F7725_014228 [Dissostichus mawsoni]|uniref:VWFA domain-containing protein n=1 Tax=Dissostichus mawsoni TaxID=36200 RepID=A0A7J5YVR1_DISMA|nr:hypothetical protein F7725_014228 [Dissostichus mawsoni]